MKMYRSVHGLSGSMLSTSTTGTCVVAHHQVSFLSCFIIPCTIPEIGSHCGASYQSLLSETASQTASGKRKQGTSVSHRSTGNAVESAIQLRG
jgi:hypothetical protein